MEKPMGASRWARHWTAAILGLSALFGASGASAQGIVKNTVGEWQMRCETPAGATAEQCALVQNVVAEDRPNVTLVIIVLKTADGKSRLLRVVAPLGILLPSGLGLKIDQTDIGRRSEEHTSELQSRRDLVCRLLLEKKKDDPPRQR